MRFPWSGWPLERKVKVLVAVLASFLLILLAWDNFDRYLYNIVVSAIEKAETTFRVSRMVLIVNSSAPELEVNVSQGCLVPYYISNATSSRYVLNVTFSMKNPSSLTVKLLWAWFEVIVGGFSVTDEDAGSFILGNVSIPSMVLHPGDGFNVTFSYPIDGKALSVIEKCGYNPRYVLWGEMTLQAAYLYKNVTEHWSTRHPFHDLENLPKVNVELVNETEIHLPTYGRDETC